VVLLCRFHHRLMHKHRLRAVLSADGVFRVWDVNGDELGSVPPPVTGVVGGRGSPQKHQVGELIEGLRDLDVRQRVRDAIHRFQAATSPPTAQDLQQIQLVRRRLAALTRA
jgi:hypothetical protein